MINPWIGIITSFAFMAKVGEKRRLEFVTALMILFTVILFQLSLPMPHDLATTKNIYTATSKFHFLSDLSILHLSRDPLSYGVQILLAKSLPSLPISFYLLNIILGFYCVWFIYKKQKLFTRLDDLILFSGLFLLILDYQETHHFLRQTAALLILICTLYITGPKKYILLLASIFWHGSMILFTPAIFLNFLFKKNKKNVLIYLGIFFLVWCLSYINIYNIFSSEYFTNKAFEDFNFADRFLGYFRHSRYDITYNIYREIGNPLAIYYTCLGVLVTVYSFVRNRFQNPILTPIMVMTLWIVFFRYHILIYDRLQYGFIILLLLFWTIELSTINLKNKKIFGTCFIALCFLKIFLFNWTLDTSIEGKRIYLYSPIELVLKIRDWPINK